MKFKNESRLLEFIKTAVSKRPSGKNVAVFDADGTIWAEDSNHSLLTYQIKRGESHFRELLSESYQKNREKLCKTFAQKHAGLSLKEFRALSMEALTQNPLHVFTFQRQIFKELKRQGMTIVIISASMQYLLETAVQLYDLPVDQVLGVQTELTKDSLLSDSLIQPSSYQNKAEVFKKHYAPDSCFLAGGNTPADLPLLELASIGFVVHSSNPASPIFQKELAMKQQALQKKWLLFEK